MPNPNFTLKLSLDEANDTREALEKLLAEIKRTPARTLKVEGRHQAGRIEQLLQREFGTVRTPERKAG